jgi:hypothetical protein
MRNKVTKTTLYDLSSEAIAIEQCLIDSDGELTPELETRIDELLVQGSDKMDAAAYMLRRLKALSDECKAESDRLAARKASFLRAHDSLKHRMLGALILAFAGKLKTAKNTFYIGHSAARKTYECNRLEKLEQDYPELVKITRTLNTEELKKWKEFEGDLPDEITVTEVEGTEFLGIH